MLTVARDQELRFTVHDSPDYHRIKVSVFNDDRKTELIGDTFINLAAVISPGGGQSDGWHTLDCRGKYAGEIRIEFTYYDTRPKAERPAPDKKRDPAYADPQSPTVAGPRGARESTPIKRRPLPSDPTAASPSPASTPEHRGLQGVRAGPRELGSPRHRQEPAPLQPSRRPVPEASPVAAPASRDSTPARQQPPPDPYTPPNPRASNPSLAQYADNVDMSYAAPKPYEVAPVDALPRHMTDAAHARTMSQDDFRSPRAHAQPAPEPVHSHSAPVLPTQHTYELEQRYAAHAPSYAHDPYDDPSYHVAPLRSSRSNLRIQEQAAVEQYPPNNYMEASSPYDERHSLRRQSAMQPTVEDEDFDLPPPPPAHRKNATTLPHKYSHSSFNPNESPAPLNFTRHQEPSPEPSYDLQRQPYAAPDYDYRQPAERRYTHPRPSVSNSRPVSRDAMAPSPLRQETSLPAALVAGLDASRRERDPYQAPPAYETPPRLRQYSEPAEYRAPPQYTAAVQPHELVHYQAQPDAYYEHDPPEEPRRRSPVNDYAPLYKPRAHSPNPSPRHSPNPVDERASRLPARSMPTRKSVSPRPPPPEEDFGQRRLSGVPFGPDDFNVLNPSLANADEPERPGSSMEYNDKGQIVTFSGRVVDASDHLPIDNWAPEPEPKGTVKAKEPRIRAQLNGSRNLQEAQAREEKYRRDRAERDRIRTAADMTFGTAPSPSQALVTTRRHASPSPAPSSALVLADRDAHDARRPTSRGYDAPRRDREALRERHTPNAHSQPGPYSRHAAPPVPAKIPLDRGMQNEDVALSLELQSIDIGPGSGGRRRRGREGGAFV